MEHWLLLMLASFLIQNEVFVNTNKLIKEVIKKLLLSSVL